MKGRFPLPEGVTLRSISRDMGMRLRARWVSKSGGPHRNHVRREKRLLCAEHGVVTGRQWVKLRKQLRRAERAS